jgi:hypothetical protein
VGGLLFPVFRIHVWWGGLQVVAVSSSPIISLRLQPYLDGDVEKLVGVVWSSRTSSGCGDLQIVKELIGGSSFFFVSGTYALVEICL